MKIAFVVTHLSHGSPGSFVRVQEIARHLATKFEIHTTILTPFQEDIKNISETEMLLIPNTMARLGISSITYRLARTLASSPITSKFFLSEQSISRMVSTTRSGIRRLLKHKKFDILHAVQHISAVACGPIAKELGIPLVSDIHNIWSEEASVEFNIHKDRPTYLRLQKLEQYIIDNSDAITVVSDLMKDYIKDNYRVTTDKIIKVIPPSGPRIDVSEQSSRNSNVVYAGMVNRREHVDLFARSLPHIKSNPTFYISNHGDSLSEIKKIISQQKSNNVNYVWFKNRIEVLDFLQRSKVGVLTSRNDITRQLGPPLKLFDYLACGIPIVANDIGGWTSMIEAERVGFLTSDDPIEFAHSIDILLQDKKLWKNMSVNAYSLIKEKYNWQNIVKNNLIPVYEKLLK